MVKNGLKGLVLILLFSALNLIAQESVITENDVIKNADALYAKEDYQGALPLYAQLVSLHSEDPQFNYRFGVCTLFGDRKDKKKPIKYLNTAFQTMKDDKELLYFLGLAYHQNQEWSNAMKFYNLYLAKLTPNAPDRAVVLEKVNSCLNGLTLADKNLISEVVSTSKFQFSNFHRAYAAQDFIGSLMLKPDIFISESERKTGSTSFVYLVHPGSVIYFSGYSDSDNSNKDIFISEMDEKGDWGKPVNLSGSINTSYDEDFPVLVDNGNTLFFCSKGHNSLGGYDVFKSMLDPQTNTFQEPENLGPGINSPFDDILFIPTKEKPYAYFASDRDNLNGAVTVYKVKLSDNVSTEGVLANNNHAGMIEGKNESSNQINIQNNTNTTDEVNIAKQDNVEPGGISDASKKASTLINDKSKSNALADSAFTMIADLKNLLRDLTNKRDRANAIAQRKTEEAKTVEARLKESIDLLASQQSEEAFLAELEKSVQIKEELYQLQQRSAQANKIAWNLGNQIKIKNQELNDLKTLAGKIQSTSVSGTYEETLFLYSGYKKHVVASDTIVDYTKPLMAITNDESNWQLPASELQFAENIKKAYYNNTLLAELSTKKPVVDENIPIVIMDKKTSTQDNKPAEILNNNSMEALALVQQVQPVNGSNINTFTDEILEINLAMDNRMEASPVVQQVISGYKEVAAGLIKDEILEIDFAMDNRTEALALVQQVIPDQKSSDTGMNEEILDINLSLDNRMEAIALVQQVIPIYTLNSEAIMNEVLEIDLKMDNQVEALQLVQPILANISVPYTETIDIPLELNFKVDEVTAVQLIEPVMIANTVDREIITDDELVLSEIHDDQPVVVALNLIEPVFFNSEATVEISPDEMEIDLNFNVDQSNNEIAVADQMMTSVVNNEKESGASIAAMETRGIDIALGSNNQNENSIELRNKEVSKATTTLFFREALIQSNGIESYSSDIELLKKALTNPDELSYEELLYAASLTDIQEEKLAIYNVAFVHIDRDWRAFNNAAISAIHVSDLNSADCYLIQASMLSENNGQIENNKGILAYQKNNLKEASACFALASKLGFDAQYNLQLVSVLAEKIGSGNIGNQKDSDYNNLKDAVVDLYESENSDK